MIQLFRFIVINLSVILCGSILLVIAIDKRPKTFGATNAIWFFFTMFAVIGTVVANVDQIYFQASQQASATVPSYVTVLTAEGEEIDIKLSWDVLSQDPITQIDWGTMQQDTTAEEQFWIKNAATKDVFLTVEMTEWVPADADQVLTLRWDWENLNAWRTISGDWAIVNGELHVSATTRDSMLVREDPGFNYEISTKAKVVTSDGRPEAQVIFRFRDESNFYFAGLGAWGYKAAIGVFDAGAASMLASGGNPDYQDIVLDQRYDLKIRVAGSTFTVYVDGQEICSVDDTTHGFGSIGLTSIHSNAVFDDYKVVDAFDPSKVIFEDYFMGPPLEVGTSRKVTLYLDAGCPGTGTGSWDFSFNIIVTAYDEPPLTG